MTQHQVIPEAAAAAARAIYERHGARYYDPDVSWDDLQAKDQESWLHDARLALDAAAPHMLGAAKADAWDACEAAKYLVMLKADGSGFARVKTNPYRIQDDE